MNLKRLFLTGRSRLLLAVLTLLWGTLPTAVFAGGAAEPAHPAAEKVTLVLDWVPNTNHAGVYTALELGLYDREGIRLTIVQPAESTSPLLVAAGRGEFGISFQDELTYALTGGTPLPLRAVAAILQHNTSGFASLPDRHIRNPKDFEGRTYGGWGSEFEDALIRAVMKEAGADFSKVKVVNIGASDFFAGFDQGVDFRWIFYGWDGIRAEIEGKPIDYMPLLSLSENLDYYTPIIITSSRLLEENPSLVRRFLKATAEGYLFAAANPEKAASMLLKHAPEIPEALAVKSISYLAPYFTDEGRWGVMKESVWKTFGAFMYRQGLLPGELAAEKAFTNAYLP
ncbi:MAG: ABC transporter substrate-binding protein [Spirochaetales bacterium]|nr:MAG: ABC transporter substrate-binding protein [Spirochaetales bacterium]